MTPADDDKRFSLEVLERGFNQGDLQVFDEYVAKESIDHQEKPGTDFAAHLKEVVTTMRTAFPDLHFDVQHCLAEGEIVAFYSVMTGTHRGVFGLGPFRSIEPAGKQVRVRHMHFLRWQGGKNTDLWHLWDTAGLVRQLSATPVLS